MNKLEWICNYFLLQFRGCEGVLTGEESSNTEVNRAKGLENGSLYVRHRKSVSHNIQSSELGEILGCLWWVLLQK